MLKQKLLAITVLSICLVSILICGITYAGMIGTADGKNNMFTPSKDVRARLYEPNWNPNKGLKLVPGKMERKDPMITNTCVDEEYVAVRLTFRYENGDIMRPDGNNDMLELLKWLDVSWNNKWKLCGGSISSPAVSQPLVFYYEDPLPPGQTTEPVFNSIYVRDKYDTPGLTEAALNFLGALGEFRIEIEGAAVQAAGFDNAAAAAGILKGLFPEKNQL